ncbi:hypothetical protein [Acinetobacter seifertii]|uniref:hypothetical protein n=1 Tax=Acinetobacter seifertii TaxID=1530123 RepID=UPI001902B83D|nr:hypothetical protein [Acinetobacter seifertii]MBJ8504398.1 hypothetical protein [Acinetobacter seifertii]MCH2001627.1 hypothetical protein [Acinetobacter seifertii]
MSLISNSFKYLRIEIIKFFIPIALTFLTACIFSNLFATKELFETYVGSKIHSYLWREFFSTLGAITILLGILLIVQKFSGWDKLDYLIDLILYEIPKNTYLFGGILTGAMYAFSYYVFTYDIQLDKTPFQIFVLGSFFGLTFFLYACGAQYLLDRKKTNNI